MSEETKYLFRNAHISLAVTAVLLVTAVVLFPDDEAALETAGFVVLAITMGLFLFLNRRWDRVHDQRRHRSD